MVRRAAVLFSIACLTALLFGACSSPYQPVVDGLTGDLYFQYHECVPLGWVPVPVAGAYYPGYTASVASVAEFLDAAWVGHIARSDLHKPAARREYDILNRLVSAGLLSRTDMPQAFQYGLTPNAFPYYFDSSIYKNNRNSLQYLCYSQVVPTKVVSVQPIVRPDTYHAKGQWYRVTFAWTASPVASWARDTFLREHSVILPPLKTPAHVTMYQWQGMWHVAAFDDNASTLATVRNVNAW